MSFTSVMDKIGADIKIVFTDVMKYLPGVGTLVSLIFPRTAAPIATLENIAGLIQNSVVLVEQKYQAAGINNQAGVQKLADVLQIATPIVTDLFSKAGLTVDTQYITEVVNAVVAILNIPVLAPTAPVA